MADSSRPEIQKPASLAQRRSDILAAGAGAEWL